HHAKEFNHRRRINSSPLPVPRAQMDKLASAKACESSGGRTEKNAHFSSDSEDDAMSLASSRQWPAEEAVTNQLAGHLERESSPQEGEEEEHKEQEQNLERPPGNRLPQAEPLNPTTVLLNNAADATNDVPAGQAEAQPLQVVETLSSELTSVDGHRLEATVQVVRRLAEENDAMIVDANPLPGLAKQHPQQQQQQQLELKNKADKEIQSCEASEREQQEESKFHEDQVSSEAKVQEHSHAPALQVTRESAEEARARERVSRMPLEQMLSSTPTTEAELKAMLERLQRCDRELPQRPKPRPADLRLDAKASFRMQRIQRYISSLEYNYTGTNYFHIRKDRGAKRLAATAREIIRQAFPIKCIEAVFLAYYLTLNMTDLVRIPIRFQSTLPGATRSFKHIVMAVGHNGKWGALGISRKKTLMFKDLAYDSLSQLLLNYKTSYEELGHDLQHLGVGLPFEHDQHSSEPLHWRPFMIHFTQGQSWNTDVESAIDAFISKIGLLANHVKTYGGGLPTWFVDNHACVDRSNATAAPTEPPAKPGAIPRRLPRKNTDKTKEEETKSEVQAESKIETETQIGEKEETSEESKQVSKQEEVEKPTPVPTLQAAARPPQAEPLNPMLPNRKSYTKTATIKTVDNVEVDLTV
ncbi:Tubulinyl-Tyr carboxypeptidase 1 (Tyrosine carboxypeptidase 1) (TTCP 1) (Vasohibin-1), partial [Durusdinium trenchii]